jgi:hypothetical protein
MKKSEETKKAAHWVVNRAMELELHYNPDAQNTGGPLDCLNVSPHANAKEAIKMLKKAIAHLEDTQAR